MLSGPNPVLRRRADAIFQRRCLYVRVRYGGARGAPSGPSTDLAGRSAQRDGPAVTRAEPAEATQVSRRTAQSVASDSLLQPALGVLPAERHQLLASLDCAQPLGASAARPRRGA